MGNFKENTGDHFAYKSSFSVKSIFHQWEFMVFIIFVGINIMNMNLSENYMNFSNIMNNMVNFMDKALMVFATMMVLLLGEIDISIASIMCLSGCSTAMAFEAGAPISIAIIIGLIVGTTCGFFNGLLLVAFPELNSTIVTLGNMILFRGIAYMLLEDNAITSISKVMTFLAWGKIGQVPLILFVFVIELMVFTYLIHRTKFGRCLYAIGSNTTASYFSGIKTARVKLLVFTISGFCAGFAGMFLISKLGSARASIAKGYEMEVIAMAILGGVSTSGGKGRVLGAVIGVFSIGFLRYGLGIVNVSSQILMIIIGSLLIIAVAISNLKQILAESKLLHKIMIKSAKKI